jgi:hypothetical protein
LGLALQRLGEWLLGGRLGEGLERWEQQRKFKKFGPQAAAATANALLDPEHVKGHFLDHGRLTIQAYEERLQVFGVARDALSSASPAEPDRLGAPAGNRG